MLINQVYVKVCKKLDLVSDSFDLCGWSWQADCCECVRYNDERSLGKAETDHSLNLSDAAFDVYFFFLVAYKALPTILTAASRNFLGEGE